MITIFGHTDGFSGTSRHTLSFASTISTHEELAWISLDAGPRDSGSREPWHRWLKNGRRDVSGNVGIGIEAPDVMSHWSAAGHARIA